MKIFCGWAFAVAFFALNGAVVAQNTGKAPGNKYTSAQYDSLAAVSAFNRDTISALENYRKALELNPANEAARKSYRQLSHYYIKSGQSFYTINP